ncbi:helix-turn-helix transcriptional regulator [Sphingobacterium hotanense]|uniref:helix-turn-helix transcriptional regulator n=1 Tax=Sphingobacterium TaxID=28453 RepID=UPI0021A47826|nr:helix-turn-helix domain-containing protein [Sphingobacterium hotanense]MCT1523653.1 helix-turn-helix domain-containing protein [Sphingobacterium hotanense]
MEKTIHQGRNVRRFREMLGLKQEALAYELGEEWNQRKISLLESKEEIEEHLMKEIAAVLKVPVEAIKNFDEETAIFNIQHNYEGSTLNHSSNYQYNYKPTFNPFDKWAEEIEENRKLYERLLQVEREKTELFERLFEKLKG